MRGVSVCVVNKLVSDRQQTFRYELTRSITHELFIVEFVRHARAKEAPRTLLLVPLCTHFNERLNVCTVHHLTVGILTRHVIGHNLHNEPNIKKKSL